MYRAASMERRRGERGGGKEQRRKEGKRKREFLWKSFSSPIYKSFDCCHGIIDKIAFLKLYFRNSLPQIVTDIEYTICVFCFLWHFTEFTL